MCRMTKYCWLLVAPMSICTLPAHAESAGAPAVILYVDDTATGANDGSSWADAFTDLQAALDAAEATGGAIVEIRVAEGVYKPSRRTDPKDPRSATFALASGTRILGGFNVTGSSSQRDWEAHPTVLSGDLLGDDQPGFSNRSDNALHVVQSVDFCPQNGLIFLDGVTVRGGHSDEATYNFGAGLMAYGGVILENCAFEDNWTGPAAAEGTVAHSNGGGAVTVFGGYDTKDLDTRFNWRNCHFIGNSTSGTGGAVMLAGINIEFEKCLFQGNKGSSAGAFGFEHLGSLAFRNCKFISNQAESGAGAILAAYIISDFNIERCEFLQNEGGMGGAILVSGGAQRFIVNDTLFEKNLSRTNGGAIQLSTDYTPTFEIAGCRFIDNEALNAGGAIYTDGSLISGSVLISKTEFSRNDALYGGAIYTNEQNFQLSDATFDGNRATIGGGIAARESRVQADRCVFHTNYAVAGGAVSVISEPSTLHFYDSLFYHNRADLYGGAIAGGSGELFIVRSTIAQNNSSKLGAGLIAGPQTVITNSVIWENATAGRNPSLADEKDQIEGVPTIDYSIVKGWSGSWGGQGNSGSDPLFVGRPSGNGEYEFRLQPPSPARNAGDLDYVPTFGDTDLDGHARVLCGRVDMGAYESGFGDADCDGVVDASDFAIWVACAEGEIDAAACDAMDSDADGDFDLKDFAAIQYLH